jgi:hypothetical protein
MQKKNTGCTTDEIVGEWGEDRRQKTEDRRQKTEDRRQKTEDRRQRTDKKEAEKMKRKLKLSSLRSQLIGGMGEWWNGIK